MQKLLQHCPLLLQSPPSGWQVLGPHKPPLHCCEQHWVGSVHVNPSGWHSLPPHRLSMQGLVQHSSLPKQVAPLGLQVLGPQ